MNLREIKQAIAEDKRVFWSNEAYEVIKNKIGQYLIVCNINQHCIGLTWKNGVTLNGEEKDFFVK